VFESNIELSAPVVEEYLKRVNEIEDIFNRTGRKFLKSGTDTVSVTFPNRSSINLPSNIHFFFETSSLKDCSPSFLNNLRVLYIEDNQKGQVDSKAFKNLWEMILFREQDKILQKFDERFFKKFHTREETFTETFKLIHSYINLNPKQ
jgi:hypothetical protein